MKTEEEHKIYMKKRRANHKTTNTIVHNEIQSLKLKCHKCKSKDVVSFYNRQPYCKRCYNITKPKKILKSKRVVLR